MKKDFTDLLELSVRLLSLKKLVKCYFDRNTFFSKNNLLELILDEILHLSMVCPIRLPHFLYSSAQTAMMVSWWEERVSRFNVRRSTFSEENCFTRLHSIKSLEIRVLWTAVHLHYSVCLKHTAVENLISDVTFINPDSQTWQMCNQSLKCRYLASSYRDYSS